MMDVTFGVVAVGSALYRFADCSTPNILPNWAQDYTLSWRVLPIPHALSGGVKPTYIIPNPGAWIPAASAAQEAPRQHGLGLKMPHMPKTSHSQAESPAQSQAPAKAGEMVR